jgi:hypothetical protein
MDALDYVRDLFREGLVQSAFWHRFALTVHSPVAKNPAAFGIRVLPSPPPPSRPRGAGVFAVNELAYEECGAPDWDRLGRVLRTAVYNYARGAGLDRSAAYWRRKVT